MTTTKAKVATTIIAVRATALSQGSGLPRICSGISKTSGRQQGKGSDPMHRKDRFIAACNSWSEFWERAKKLPSKRQKGDVFERLTQPISRSRTSGATFRLDEVRTYAITVKTTGISTCRGIPFGADGHGVGEADRGRVVGIVSIGDIVKHRPHEMECEFSGSAFPQKPAHNAEHTYLDADHCGPQQDDVRCDSARGFVAAHSSRGF
ncbi:MAG TPA: hypothetical protein VNX61_16750 [Rhizomicrobium sp.]|nr:hypothetical protein [Rhizomicrobium sp.]